MATYYWVGGNGNWGYSETTNWALSSGGAGGAGFPTPYDNVVFDANSNTGTAAFAVTVTGVSTAPSTCNNFDASAVDGVMTLTMAATAVVNVYGNWVNPASNFAYSITSGALITFKAIALGKTVSFNNVSLGALAVTFDGIGGGWTLSTAFNGTGTITFLNGNLDTGNQTVTAGTFASSTSSTRSLTLGSSTLNFSSTAAWSTGTSVGMTLNAGTSTINCSNASPTFNGGSTGLIYNNVNFTDSTGVGSTITLTGTGANTFNNLTFTSPSVPGVKLVSLINNQTVTGTLTLGTGTTASNRIWVLSSVQGTQRTFTVATLATLANVDFRDIVAAGASGTWSGTSVGNHGNNSNITFSTPKTVYWNQVAGGNWSDAAWATSSGGTAAAANFPLGQDTAIIDTTGLNNSTTITIAQSSWAMPTLNVTKTGAFTLAYGATTSYFIGDVTLQAATIVTGTGAWNFAGFSSTQTLTTNNASVAVGVNLSSVGGTLQLGSALTLSSNPITVTSGTFTTANYNVTATALNSNNSNTRTVSLGSSTVTLTGATPIDFTVTTGLTFTPGTSTIACSSALALAFNGNGLTYYNVSFTATTAVTVTLSGANTYNNLTFTSPAVAGYKIVSLNANQTVNGTLTLGAGGTATNRIWVRSGTLTTARTLTVVTLAALSDVDFRDVTAAGTAAPFSGTRIGNAGGNSNITFTAAKTVYWNLAGAQNWSATGWALSSGGTPAVANFPLAQDTAVFDNTGSVTGTITIETFWIFGAVNVTKTGAMTLASGGSFPTIFGNVTLQAATIVTGTVTWIFSGTGTQVLTSNNCSFAPPIVVNNFGGTLQLGSNFTTTGTAGIVHNYGTFDTNNFSITAVLYQSSNTNTRALLLGSGTHTFSGAAPWDTSTATNLTLTRGTSTIVCSSTAATTFAGGGLTYYNVSFTGVSTAAITISGGATTYNNLLFTSPSAVANKVISFNSNQTVGGTLTLGTGGTATNRMLVISNSLGNQVTVTAAVLAALSDVDFRDIAATGVAAPFSGTRVGNAGNNSGITFTAAKTVYWSLAAGGTWQSSTAWATSSGGVPAIANYPLPQDTAIIDDTGITTGNTITISSASVGTLNVTKTAAITLAFGANNTNFTGSVTFQANTTVTGTSYLGFTGSTGTPVLSTNGSILPVGIQLFNNALQLGTAVTTTGAFTLTGGALDLNDKTLTCGTFSSSVTTTRSIAFGTTGNITVTGNNATVFTIATATNFSYTGTSAVNLTYSGSVGTRTLTNGSTGGSETNAINVNVTAGGDQLAIGSTGFIRNLNFTGFAGAMQNSLKNIYGNLTIPATMSATTGTSAIGFYSASNTQIVTTNGVILDFPINIGLAGTTNTVQLNGNFTQGALVSSAGVTLVSGTLDLNGNVLSANIFNSSSTNTRAIAFNGGSISVTGNNQTVFSMATVTNFTYTGTSVVNLTYSGSVGSRVASFGSTGGTEANSLNFNITAGSDLVSIGTVVRSLNLTGFSGTYSNSTKTIYGNFTIPVGLASTVGVASTVFGATSGTQVITTNSVVQDYPITFNGAAATTYQLGSNFVQGATTASNAVNLQLGTLDLNGYSLSANIFNTNYTSTRAIAFNGGSISVTGNNATVYNNAQTGFSYTGTSVINLTYSGSVGTRTIQSGAVSETFALNFNVTAGSDIVTFNGTAYIKNFNLTGFSGTLTNQTRNIYGNLTISATTTATAGTLVTTFAATSGTQIITTNGVTQDYPITFSGSAATVYRFGSAFAQGSTRAFTLTLGILQFKAGTTNTPGIFTLTANSIQKYLQSDTPGSQATISYPSGTTINANYLTLQDSAATGGAIFNAYRGTDYAGSQNNVNDGNNTGWNFIPLSRADDFFDMY